MTKRNIAIANFSPSVVEGSSWPRFTGWKMVGKPHIESGLFGLIDKGTRMHRFFKDTTFEDVLANQLVYEYRTSVRGTPLSIEYPEDRNLGAEIIMAPLPTLDFSVRWLPPYQYIDKDHVEWDVYVVITSEDIYIRGDFQQSFITHGYWDMGIWKPSFKIGEDWNDIKMIEQATINYVVASGYPAMGCINRIGDDGPREYVVKDVYQEIPGYQA